MNPMREIRIEKVTVNIGAGKDPAVLEKGISLIKNLTGINPVKTFTNKRIPTWGLRPGLPIGCKLTLRNSSAVDLLKRVLEAHGRKLAEGHFDDEGNIAFGIKEYIDIPGIKYDPAIGIMGLQVCVTLSRPGFRIKRRAYLTRKIPKRHRISRKESIDFMRKNFNIMLGDE
ncbi:50S ribosomal protein L5 [Candidatus Woesearchaeota archaeon]|nr:50S ribosomal protein L5 [Candidatus Woesearchaeota archaeon]